MCPHDDSILHQRYHNFQMTYENMIDHLPSLLFHNASTTLRSRQPQQCHCASPLVIINPPSFLSLLFDRYFTISFGDRQGSHQILAPLGGRVQKYDTSLLDPCPIVRACAYLSTSVCNHFSICFQVSTKLYHNTLQTNYSFYQTSSPAQFKMATRSLLFPRFPIPSAHRWPKLKLCHMMLQNGSHSAIVRVCMGIFAIGFRKHKYYKILDKNTLFYFHGVLLAVCALTFPI